MQSFLQARVQSTGWFLVKKGRFDVLKIGKTLKIQSDGLGPSWLINLLFMGLTHR